jgi:hypothetical protein
LTVWRSGNGRTSGEQTASIHSSRGNKVVAIPIGGFTFEFDGRAKELRKRHWPWVVGSTERNAVFVAAFIALRHYVTVTLGRKDLSFRRARVKR